MATISVLTRDTLVLRGHQEHEFKCTEVDVTPAMGLEKEGPCFTTLTFEKGDTVISIGIGGDDTRELIRQLQDRQ